METPPARGRDAAILQRQLDAASGQRLHRRRVSRSLQLEDSFFTPGSSPLGFSAPQSRFRGTPVPNNQTESPYTRLNRPDANARSPINTNFQNRIDYDPKTNNGFNANDAHRHTPHGSPRLNEPRTEYNFRSEPIPNQVSQFNSPSHSPARALSSRRRCAKCNGDISGHFVRALGAAFHIDCFTCEDCDVPCAAKFFPVDSKPLCEHCYFKRQNLLCYRCGNSLRGSYITALDRKYHVEHFTCSLCTTVFGPDDSYFEYNGDIYCRAHYSSLFAFHCEGCKSPILKQFVETYRGGKKQQWHPECYMIFKFWSVKISDSKAREISALRKDIGSSADPSKPLDNRAIEVIAHEEIVDRRTMRTWTTLCGYEEACAAEISALVQRAVIGDFRAAYDTCSRLVAQIKVLFTALDKIPCSAQNQAGSASSSDDPKEPGREAKTICRKVVSSMSLLSKTRDLPAQERMQGLAKDLLPLASAMAHYLKVLIRQGLSGALSANMLDEFLVSIGQFSHVKPAKSVSPFSTDQCIACGKAVEDKCYRQRGRHDRLWHAKPRCFKCSVTSTPLEPSTATVNEKGELISLSLATPDTVVVEFTSISKLEQYVILLHVALARLDLVLSNSKRSKSHESSPTPQEQSLVDLNSVSTPILPGQRTKDASTHEKVFGKKAISSPTSTALERTSIILHEKAGLTLDDIRRIVAAEQAKVSTGIPKDGSSNVNNTPGQQRYMQSNSMVNRKLTRYFGTLNDDEYAWSRFIAQALLQSYSLKYLKRELDAVSSSFKTPTLWGRVGKVFAKEQEGRVFGQPLDRLVSKYGVDSNLVALNATETEDCPRYTLRIPSFVDDCVMAMRQKDMSAEGVFRKNGNIRRLREFVEKIDRNPDENGLLVDESPIQLAALLKKFLRDLPDPLLCSKLSPMWALLPKLDEKEQFRVAQLLIAVLPRPNRSLLEVLANFLNWVSSFAHVDDETGSKMDIQNLATVLGPTLVLSNEDAEAAAMPGASTDSSSQFKNIGEPVKFLITDFRLVAQVPGDIVRCLEQLKGVPPRKINTQEIEELLKRS